MALTKSDELTDCQVLDHMYQHMNSRIGISVQDWEVIRRHLSVTREPTKSTLQNIGSNVENHFFISKGLVRLFYISPEGKDINKGFYSEGNIAGSLSGLILREPSRFGIETLEPSILVKMDLAKFDALMNSCVGWAKMFNYACQMMLVRNERRESELLTMTSKARYLQFCKNFKDAEKRIAQYHIASYLGITPTALSRYKNRWLGGSK